MKHMIDDVRAFHSAFGAPVAFAPSTLSAERFALRRALIAEENGELWGAVARFDMVGVADGQADLLYVLVGWLVEAGLPLHDLNLKLVIRKPPTFPTAGALVELRIEVANALAILFSAANASSLKATEMHLNYTIRLVASLANDFQLPLPDVWAEVQRSNMSKMQRPNHDADCGIMTGRCSCGAVLYRDDGKILKGDRYSPADVASILRARGWTPPSECAPVAPFEPWKT